MIAEPFVALRVCVAVLGSSVELSVHESIEMSCPAEPITLNGSASVKV